MTNLKKFVNWKLAHSDKTAEAEGYPLTMQNCKANKRMKQLEVYGNSVQDGTPTPENPIEVESVGELITDVNDANYGKYKIPLVQRGVNLFSMAKAGFTEKTVNGITFTPLDDERIHIKGKIADSSSDAIYNPPLKFKIPIEKGIYNVKPYSGIGTIMFRVDKDQSDTFLININATNTNISVKQDAYLSRIHIQINATSTKEWDDIVPIQITKGTGTKSLPYEPYVEPITTNIFLDEPLRKIGDYADYVDFKNKKVVRNTFVRVYNGTYDNNNPFTLYDNEANWGVNSDANENFWIYHLNDTLPVIPKYGHTDFKHPPICSQFPTICHLLYTDTDLGKINKECIWFIQNARNVVLFLSKDRLDGTLTALRNFLKENPLRVTIATYQPYEETITIDLPKLNAKTTIIEVDTSLAPSNAKGKYIKS